jgi:hypothetical protein
MDDLRKALTDEAMTLCVAMVRAGLARAALIADNFPADTHGNLPTDPREAARQAAQEISAAIRAMSRRTGDAP